jgi:hypothetical protein
MKQLLALASGYSFPMVITIYLLVRIKPLIRSLKEPIDTLTLIVAMQNGVKVNDLDNLKDKIDKLK